MFNNYEYFITLAEEKNISRASEKLFISHQCLSRYLKKLENDYGVTFFERGNPMKITFAGQALLDMLKKLQFMELNFENQLNDIRQSKKGIIRLGTTEGRFRILFPDLLTQFSKEYPEVTLSTSYATSKELKEQIAANDLDLALVNDSFLDPKIVDILPLYDERFYLVISDAMLRQYFPGKTLQDLCGRFARGADLRLFKDVPFILNQSHFNSRIALENYLNSAEIELKCLMEMTQLDLHFMMTQRDYAASFCWSMYIPLIQRMNRADPEHHLNIFPICGMEDVRNHMVIIMRKGKILPEYGKALVKAIRKNCRCFDAIESSLQSSV